MTVEMLWSLYILVLLFSAHAAHSHKGSGGTQGLSCVNDFVNNLSCTWNSAPVTPGGDCRIVGFKTIWLSKNYRTYPVDAERSCELRQHRNSPPGCNIVFENEVFSFFETMPNISVECNGRLVENITNYKPEEHIKMSPPGVPIVNRTANDTWISWSPGSPLSDLIKKFNFEVQVTQKDQTWKEARTLSTQDQKIKIPSSELKEKYQVRVRVRCLTQCSHWSNWSPSWIDATDVVVSHDQDWFWMKRTVLFSVIVFVTIFILYGTGMISGYFRHLKGKPVPNPSKYFHTLDSVHKGNLKKWLNPLSASESFFMAETSDPISPVELCERWEVVPSTSPCSSSSSSSSSTDALLHFQSYPSADSDTSGIVDNFSSSSSSCFYNMDYFMSTSSSSSAQTDSSPPYFTYRDDFHNLNSGHNLHVSLCPSFTAPPAYETLKREPQSPDSGFSIEKENEEDKKDEGGMDAEGEDVSLSPLFFLPLHLPSRISPLSSVPPPPHLRGITQKSSDSQQGDVPVADAADSYAAWPVTGAMCRSSSMPVEPCKTGYLTLKELQTTFSNKSI